VNTLTLVAPFLPLLAFGQTARTWHQVTDNFEASNYTLKSARLNINGARAVEITAHLRPNPTKVDQINPFSDANPIHWRPGYPPFAAIGYLGISTTTSGNSVFPARANPTDIGADTFCSAPARSGLGVHTAAGWNLPACRSERWCHAVGQHAGNYLWPQTWSTGNGQCSRLIDHCGAVGK
jgi:hypothetical protein